MTVCSKQFERAECARVLICRLLSLPDDTPLGELMNEIDKNPDTDIADIQYLMSEVLAPLTREEECCDCGREETK